MDGTVKVLGLDTATSACSVALWEGEPGTAGRPLAHRFAAMARGQAERLLPMIEEVMAEAGTGYDALDRIGVTVGPGAFTGLRIGLATARGLALAAGRPALGVTTFEAIAHGLSAAARQGRRLLVAVESKRDELYLQLFDDAPAPLGMPWAAVPAAVPAALPAGPLLVAGDGAPRLAAVLTGRPDTVFAPGPGTPDAAVVAWLAAQRPPGAPPAPLYLRPPHARLPEPHR